MKNNFFNRINGEFTDEDIKIEAQKIIDDDVSETWLKNAAKNFINNYKNRFALRDEVIKLTEKYLG